MTTTRKLHRTTPFRSKPRSRTWAGTKARHNQSCEARTQFLAQASQQPFFQVPTDPQACTWAGSGGKPMAAARSCFDHGRKICTWEGTKASHNQSCEARTQLLAQASQQPFFQVPRIPKLAHGRAWVGNPARSRFDHGKEICTWEGTKVSHDQSCEARKQFLAQAKLQQAEDTHVRYGTVAHGRETTMGGHQGTPQPIMRGTHTILGSS